MTHFYVFEIQEDSEGNYADLVHHVFDEDPLTAMLKGESKYHQVLAAAAISGLPSHAAIMFRADGTPVYNKCYKHSTTTQEE